MTGGINRFVDEARPDQCIDAVDVWERDGDLCRRPAFIPVATGAPYLLPCGATSVLIEILSPQSFIDYGANRSPVLSNAIGGVTRRLWIGCSEAFDGVDWRIVSSTPTPSNATGNARLKPMYRDSGNQLQPIYGAVDTTRKLILQGSNPTVNYVQPLWKNGRISWNKSVLVANDLWTATTLNSISAFWVAFDLSADVMLPGEATPASISFPFSAGNVVVSQRGLRCFTLNPVNGLMPTRTKGNARVVVTGTDFARKRGNTLGAGLGYVRSHGNECEIARIVEDEGSGAGADVAAAVWGGGTWADGTSGSNITKHRRDYEWMINNPPPGIDVGQFDGAPVLRVTADAGSTTRTVHAATGWQGNFDLNFENHRMRCVSGGGGGPAVGEEVEIWRCSTNVIDTYYTWSLAPVAGNVFEIRKPPSFVRTREGKTDYEIDNVQTAHRISYRSDAYANAASLADTQAYVNFEIFKESFWALNPAVRWCGCFDSVTGQLILTNGENGLLSFDGLRTRWLEALWDATEGVPGSAIVRLWRGIVQDLVTRHGDPNLVSGSDLRRSPPNGRYVVDFSGRIVVAHIRERQQSVIWSAPGGLNNLWPLTYEALVRDSDNNPITGVATLGNYLAVFTKTSIHLGAQPNDRGEIYFKPASQGIGFTAHAAVSRIAVGGQDALIGPSVDGIYIFNGGEPTAVLDDWRRVLKKGVNKGKLERAVGAALHSENLYFLAVAEGGSETLNKLIVVDYSRAPNAQIWVWSAPGYDGFSMIARDVRANGDERVLFGMTSGHVCELMNAEYDGWGAPFEGYAVSKPIRVEGGRAAFSKAHVKVKPTSKGIDVAVNINRSDLSVPSMLLSNDAVPNAAIYGSSNYNDSTRVYTPPSIRTYPVNLPSGIVGEEISLKLSSARQWRFGGAEVFISPKGQKSQ